MKDRRKLWLRLALWALVIAWMAVIFHFSAQAADDSDRTSGRVVAWLIDHFDRSFSSLSPEAQLLRMEAWSFAVRKLAHFVVFAVLGLLTFAAFSKARQGFVSPEKATVMPGLSGPMTCEGFTRPTRSPRCSLAQSLFWTPSFSACSGRNRPARLK